MLRLQVPTVSLGSVGNAPQHSLAHTPADRWLPTPGHLHSHCPAALAHTTALAPLKVTDSPLSFSSRSRSSAFPPTCPGVPRISLAAILPHSYWLTFSIPPFLLVFRSCFLSLLRSFVAVPAPMRVKAGIFLRYLASDWLIPETLDHRVEGTQGFHNLPHKMAIKVEATEKGVTEMSGRLTQTDT